MARAVLPVHAAPMVRPSFALRRPWRLLAHVRVGLRAWVLGGSALVVIGLSLAVSAAASDQLRGAAIESALENAQAIVRGYVDTILTEDDLAIDAVPDPAVTEQIGRLVISGDMRRINIWTRDGRV